MTPKTQAAVKSYQEGGIEKIYKRDGLVALYDITKIEKAIAKAFEATGELISTEGIARIAKSAEKALTAAENLRPSVEEIQDEVENAIMKAGNIKTAKAYVIYREQRRRAREEKSKLLQDISEIIDKEACYSDTKRNNANVDGNTAMGLVLQTSSAAMQDAALHRLPPDIAKKHIDGSIHIHDIDFMVTGTTTCCQIDIGRLFENGFSTGHGHLRSPASIRSAASLACIVIQANQNDQHGGQSIPNFDYALAPYVDKSYRKAFVKKYAELLAYDENWPLKDALAFVREQVSLIEKEEPAAFTYGKGEMYELSDSKDRIDAAISYAAYETDQETKQAMEALVHNLNTMHSRCGGQTPFSSINYGLDTSLQGRLIVGSLLEATYEGLGKGETPIFPIHVYRLKDGINTREGDPNYDLFKLACRVSAKRLFPNFSFIDAPFNLKYYKEGRPETEVAYMGCRTKVIANVYDPLREVTYGRGNLSFTSVNIVRLAIESSGNEEKFFSSLKKMMDAALTQLLFRFRIQAAKKGKNFPMLMGQGVWQGSEGLSPEDAIGEALNHGTLSIGFIGLAEALVALTGKHHGEDEGARGLGIKIVSFMRDFCDAKSEELKMNVTLLATPGEGLSGRFVAIDKERYGSIEGVTDREYYTNSFHVPVHYKLSAFEKIRIEAPYHALTNAGHITYVELDGDPEKNLDAFERVILAMKDEGVGYGSINHPVDRDPVCGYQGIIADVCPGCGRVEDGAPFERIRRITGYLVGSLERFGDAKKAEERDRIKHF